MLSSYINFYILNLELLGAFLCREHDNKKLVAVSWNIIELDILLDLSSVRVGSG